MKLVRLRFVFATREDTMYIRPVTMKDAQKVLDAFQKSGNKPTVGVESDDGEVSLTVDLNRVASIMVDKE